MVPVVDFHSYREFLKKAIIQRLDKTVVDEYPNDYAWLVYSLALDGKEDNPLFSEAFDNLFRWASTNIPHIPNKFLPALGTCVYLQGDKSEGNCLTSYLVIKLVETLGHEIDRFSPLNDPSFVLPIVLGVRGTLTDPARITLVKICEKNGRNGKAFRRAMFVACTIELDDEQGKNLTRPDGYINPEDIMAMLWFGERYHPSNVDTSGLWSSFGNIKELISTEELSELGAMAYYLSNIDLAFLYESITYQTERPDPRTLFNIYPMHERIRQVSRSLFEQGEFSASVFEATKVLESVVREKTGLENTGRSLMQEAMNVREPRIKFNRLETRSERDEQEGLKLIAEGIIAAYRNPKGHEPKDTSWGDISPYDALDQLISISHIMKRI